MSTAAPLIAVTGGNGFLGRELVRALLQTGHRVRVLSSSGRRVPGLSGADTAIEYVRGDLTNAQNLAPFLDGAGALFHLAGSVSRGADEQARLMQIHVEGTRRLLAAVDRSAVRRVILLSTSGTVGVSTTTTPATDESPYALDPALRWPYYASKIFQEKLAIAWAVGARQSADTPRRDLVCLRPTLVLGPGDTDYSSTGDIKKYLEQKIPGIPPGGLSFVDARDVAQACLAALALDPVTIGTQGWRTYLLGATNLDFRAYLALLARLSGVPAPTLEIPGRAAVLGARAWALTGEFGRRVLDLDPVSAEMANYFWYINSDRARAELGWQPRPPEETLRDTIEFIKSQERT